MLKIKNNKVSDFLLSISLFMVSLYAANLILSPFYGEVKYYIGKRFYKNSERSINQIISIENNIKLENKNSTKNSIKNNILYIPSIDLATSIQELEKLEDLHFGSWRRPNTSNPELGGNTVIVAHRYTDKGGRAENTFYNLPKVEIGEYIYTFWNNKKYTYKVYDIKVVESNDETVEKSTTTANILTLYTCTPLWSSTHRYVVYSKLISVEDLK